ncbi:Hypothetical predicted protein [Cloeon dipterum]|uniref:Uncharacterized protein n=1 Tax=Cloeon dipterum TaxID=197152 RepID=A0A8S1DTU1_9INSE|nr:Hypothetical predicted protein [Cloeon dipterum]
MERTCAILILSLSVIISLTSSCFITNCPPGGKRSDITPLFNKDSSAVTRRCARCGPGLTGRCFGPRICCSDKLGCTVGPSAPSFEAFFLPCVAESLFPEACTNGPRAACGKDEKGVCGAPGVCCSHNQCHADSACLVGSGRFYNSVVKSKAEEFKEDFYEKPSSGQREYYSELRHPMIEDDK